MDDRAVELGDLGLRRGRPSAGQAGAAPGRRRSGDRGRRHGAGAGAPPGGVVPRGGHAPVRWEGGGAAITRGTARRGSVGRARNAPAARSRRSPTPCSIIRAQWGLAARGARVEAGTPEFDFTWRTRSEVGPTKPPRIYRRPPPRSGTRHRRSPGRRHFACPRRSKTPSCRS